MGAELASARAAGAEGSAAVVSALARELAPLRRRVRGEARFPTSRGRFFHGRLGDRAVVFGWTGDGRRAAADGLRALLERRVAGRLILLGVAGALSPDLRPGELVVAGEIRDGDGAAPPPAPEMTRRALAVPGATAGTIYSAENIVATAGAKARLWRALARPAGAVVDLETAAWARLAAAHGVPYVAVRAVSDAAGDDLPLDFERFRDRRGRVRNARVALAAARRPSLIAPLRRLRRRVDGCAGALAAWTVTYLG